LIAWLTQRVSCQCNVCCSGLQIKPSWHKLNHQNCSAACQDAKPLYDYFPLSSRHKRRSIDQCASVHALQGISCLLLRNMPCRKLPISATFSAPSKVFFLKLHQVKLMLLPVSPLLFQSPTPDRGGKRAFIGSTTLT
jgi:hypothetical protein